MRYIRQKNKASIIASKILQNCKLGRVPRASTVERYGLSITQIADTLNAWEDSLNTEDPVRMKAIKRLSVLMEQCRGEKGVTVGVPNYQVRIIEALLIM